MTGRHGGDTPDVAALIGPARELAHGAAQLALRFFEKGAVWSITSLTAAPSPLRTGPRTSTSCRGLRGWSHSYRCCRRIGRRSARRAAIGLASALARGSTGRNQGVCPWRRRVHREHCADRGGPAGARRGVRASQGGDVLCTRGRRGVLLQFWIDCGPQDRRSPTALKSNTGAVQPFACGLLSRALRSLCGRDGQDAAARHVQLVEVLSDRARRGGCPIPRCAHIQNGTPPPAKRCWNAQAAR